MNNTRDHTHARDHNRPMQVSVRAQLVTSMWTKIQHTNIHPDKDLEKTAQNTKMKNEYVKEIASQSFTIERV